MLRLAGAQAECLFDEVLSDPELLRPIVEHWWREAERDGRSACADGRPTIAMASYVRLMVVKQRTGWGYETLVREVSDSLHLRRFCLIPLHGRVPDESTLRKLTRRLGPGTVAELTRAVIAKARRERRFRARAARIDSTVVEADVRYPSDAALCLQGARALARSGSRLAERVGEQASAVRDRSRAIGRRVRRIARTLARRTGKAKEEVIALNAEAGELLRRSRSWPAAPSGSQSRRPSGCKARRSRTGSSPSPTQTLGRSARASSASRTSSATWPRSAR